MKSSAKNDPSWWATPHPVLSTTDTRYWSKSQTGRNPTESCTGKTPPPAATPTFVFGSGGPPRRNSDVPHSEEKVILASDGEQCILNLTEWSGLNPASRDLLQAPEADDARPHSQIPRVCRGGVTRLVEEK